MRDRSAPRAPIQPRFSPDSAELRYYDGPMTFTRPTFLVIAGIASVLAAAPAHALRCGNKLVTDGMHIAKVLSICGEPAFEENKTILVDRIVPYQRAGRRVYKKDANGRYVTPGLGRVVHEVVITELTYNFGPYKLMRRLRFANGRLEDIEQLGYGYR